MAGRRAFAVVAVLLAVLVTGLLTNTSATTPRGFIGLEFDRMTPAAAARTPLRKTRGALIVHVVPGSPADRAGIKAGEVLARIDGASITLAREASDIVKSHKPGDRVTLTLFDVTSGDIHPHEIAVTFAAELPTPKVLSVKPPRTLARARKTPPVLAANAAWSKAIARGPANPRALTALSAGRCSGFAPEDWRVVDSNARGRVLHLLSPDGGSHAIYKIIPFAAADDPRRIAAALVTDIFRTRVTPGPRENLAYDLRIFHFGMANGGTGFALYRMSGRTLSVWIAAVPASDASWAEPVAGAVALSIRCVSDLTPLQPQSGPAALPPVDVSTRCLAGACGEDDFAGAYLAPLHLGYVHSTAGDLFLVDPRRDFWQSGPEGPGYYRQVGGMVEKLEPGRTN